MARPPPCYHKLNVRKGGNGSAQEDAEIFAFVSNKHRPPAANSTPVSKKSGHGRCGKSCRHKCSKHLRPDLRRQSFTPKEEELIINLHAAIGSRWFMIAQQLPGRSDNDVKNYWNTKLKKKLCEMGIDHVTHKPFSQIIADYGSIGAFPRPAAAPPPQITDFNNTEQSPPLLLLQLPNLNTSPESSLLGYNYTSNDHTQSLDLLTQLQAITLVAQAPNHHDIVINQPQFSSSSSSSSSPSSIANEGWLPAGFSWRDFLLEDSIPPQNGLLKQENLEEEVSVLKHSSNQVGIDIELQHDDRNTQVNDIPMISSSFKGSTDGTSFVEAMLEGEQDMFMEFPGLLEEEPFFY